MIASLPSDDDLRAMLAGTERGRWVCWVYPIYGSTRTVRVWNRNPQIPPLDRHYEPVGCVVIDL